MSTVYEPVVDAPNPTLNPSGEGTASSGASSTPENPAGGTSTTIGGDLTDGKIINYK